MTISSAEISAALTKNGAIPEGCAFLFNGLIHVWNPDFYFTVLIIESNDLAQACRKYLQAEHREFATLDEAEAIAIRDKWPGWERILAFPRHNTETT